MTTPPLAAGWYPDPTGRPGIVYWDGERWRTEIPAPPTGQPAEPHGQKGLIAALVATIVLLIAGIAGVGGYFLLQHHRAAMASRTTAPPLTEAALSGLLLAPDQLKTVTNTAFFTTSARRWVACSNHQMKVSMPAGTPAVAATVGPVANTNGTLSATMTQSFGGNTVNIQRALTTAKNVIIDVFTISQAPLPTAPATVAHQIAAKIPAA